DREASYIPRQLRNLRERSHIWGTNGQRVARGQTVPLTTLLSDSTSHFQCSHHGASCTAWTNPSIHRDSERHESSIRSCFPQIACILRRTFPSRNFLCPSWFWRRTFARSRAQWADHDSHSQVGLSH